MTQRAEWFWTCGRCPVVVRVGNNRPPDGWERDAFWYCGDPACDGHERWRCGACVAAREVYGTAVVESVPA